MVLRRCGGLKEGVVDERRCGGLKEVWWSKGGVVVHCDKSIL